jgi:hypothetical protein
MKRIFFLVWAVMVLGAPLLSAGTLVVGAPVVPTAEAATTKDSDCDTFKQSNPDGSASTQCATGSGLNTNSKDCNGVKIGLPILNKGENCIGNNASTGGAIVGYLRLILRLLSGAVGLVIVAMIVVSGVRYIASTGDPGQVKTAKTQLQNAILALVLYLSMFAILTFITPGGIL